VWTGFINQSVFAKYISIIILKDKTILKLK
jgi:hypothetical protein